MFTEYFLHVSCSPAFKLCQYPVPNNNNNNNNKWLGKKLRAKSFFFYPKILNVKMFCNL